MAESKKIYRGKTDFYYRSDVFVGNTMVRLVSVSSVRGEAKRHFDEFVAVMDIIDVEPPAPGTTPTATPAALSGGLARGSDLRDRHLDQVVRI